MNQLFGGRHRRVRPVLIACAGLAAALLAGCSGGGTVSSHDAAGAGSSTVTVAYNTDLESWNPYAQSSTPSYSRWSNIFEPLISYDHQTEKYVPRLATSWNVSGNNWTFHLRQGVKFQSGNPFTSADVVHAFNRIKNDPDSLQQGNLDAVTKITAKDASTVVLTTARPSATLLSNLINAYITSKVSYDKYGKAQADHHPDGTGPYRFVSWQPGAALTLKKNPNYWGKEPAGMPDNLVFKLISSPEDAVAALRRGEIDIDTNLPIQDHAQIQSGGARLATVNGDRTMFFAFNTKMPPFDNVLVRQAISYAIDTKGIINSVLQGEATQMNGPVPQNVYGSDPSLMPYPYDPGKAKQLLAQAGATGAAISIDTTTNRYPNDVEVAQAVQQQLQKVGLKVTVATPDFGTYSSDMSAGKLGFYQISRGNYVDAAVLLAQYYKSGVTKRTQYSNAKVDALLDAQASELDAAKRLDDLHQAEAQILKDAPAVFFGAYKDLYGLTSRVSWTPNVDELIQGISMTVK